MKEMSKARTIIGPYGIEAVVEDSSDLAIVQPLAAHGLNDCGHHYNIFEPDDGFPQDRFYNNPQKNEG
jgi:hypothetical protein